MLAVCCILSKFYIKPQLIGSSVRRSSSCILSKFYIKPQQQFQHLRRISCCILSKFYIKPQQRVKELFHQAVVSYRNSTSNHNSYCCGSSSFEVVSYRNSTSNHNCHPRLLELSRVVSYRNSTSNHNSTSTPQMIILLYLIEILHQTTTQAQPRLIPLCCILSKFYIKPQHPRLLELSRLCCILSKFYIKPQLSAR